MAHRNVYLKIIKIPGYNPVNPPTMRPHQYKRDCMRNEGHENGLIPDPEVNERTIDAIVYREFYDEQCLIPKIDRLILTDVNEPELDHLPGTVIYTYPGEYGTNDRLKIHVTNGDDTPHSFHIHGLEYGIDSDGSWPFGTQNTNPNIPGRSDEICPGEKWIYTYKVTSDVIGAWPFHDHYKNIDDNINRGLFGGLVVLPDETYMPPQVILQSGWMDYINDNNDAPSQFNKKSLYDIGIFVEELAQLPEMQPQVDPEDIIHAPVFIHFMAGESHSHDLRILLRNANGGPPFGTDEDLIPGGPTYSHAFGDIGEYKYHCSYHAAEMRGKVTVDPVNGSDEDQLIQVSDFQYTPNEVIIKPYRTVTWEYRKGAGIGPHTVTPDGVGAARPTWCINGRAFVGNSPTIEVSENQTIRWYVFNLDLGMMWHNFHTHGMRFKNPVFKLGSTSAGNDDITREDVKSIGPAESFIVETMAPKILPDEYPVSEPEAPGAEPYNIKGEFLFHCHVELHMMQGLVGMVRVKKTVWLTEEQKNNIELNIGLQLDDGSNNCPNPVPVRCINHEKGVWEDIPAAGITMMHAVLLPYTERVLIWGYQNSIPPNYRQSTMWDNNTKSYVDPTNQPATAYNPLNPDPFYANVHSAEHTHLNTLDFSILIHGGFTGPSALGKQSFIFHQNPFTADWEWVYLTNGQTADGRFYSTTLTLPGTNGTQAITLYGSSGDNGAIAYTYEIFDVSTGQWSQLTNFPVDPQTRRQWDYQYYPWAYILPGGDWFIGGHEEKTRRFTLNTPSEPTLISAWLTGKGNRSRNVPKPPPPGIYDNEDGTSVILPLRPDDNGIYTDIKVLIAGGDSASTWSSAQVLNLSGQDTAWSDIPNLIYPRTHMVNSVILSNGHVLIAGGAVDVVNGGPCEILNPRDLQAGWFEGASLKRKSGIIQLLFCSLTVLFLWAVMMRQVRVPVIIYL
jgi:FtsP/CotA-like multicopper oxidase with cupredoxin domain